MSKLNFHAHNNLQYKKSVHQSHKKRKKNKKLPQPRTLEELQVRQAKNKVRAQQKMERLAAKIEEARKKKLYIQQQWENLGK
jgi:hypothetical protein